MAATTTDAISSSLTPKDASSDSSNDNCDDISPAQLFSSSFRTLASDLNNMAASMMESSSYLSSRGGGCAFNDTANNNTYERTIPIFRDAIEALSLHHHRATAAAEGQSVDFDKTRRALRLKERARLYRRRMYVRENSSRRVLHMQQMNQPLPSSSSSSSTAATPTAIAATTTTTMTTTTVEGQDMSPRRHALGDATSTTAAAMTKNTMSMIETPDPLIYAKPMRLPRDCHRHGCLRCCGAGGHADFGGGGSLEELSAAILFNVALAYHLAGERRGSKEYIARAASFYRTTETMLLKAVGQLDENDNGCRGRNGARTLLGDDERFLDVLVKATMNNMGQICMEWWGRHDLGREYFERLGEVCSCCSSEYNVRQGNGGICGWDVFNFNAFVVRGMNSSPAA